MAPSGVFIDDDMGPENCMGSYRCGWLLQSPHGGESITAYTVIPYTVEPLSVVERDGQIRGRRTGCRRFSCQSHQP